MFDDSEKRWVEITMCYHVLRGLKQMQETGDLPPISLGYVFTLTFVPIIYFWFILGHLSFGSAGGVEVMAMSHTLWL